MDVKTVYGGAVNSLSTMLKIESITGVSIEKHDEFRKFRNYIRTRYSETFDTAQILELGGNLIIHIKGANPDLDPVLFCTHMDVMPADGTWDYGPFSGAIADGKIWGRGALKGKGVLCSIFEALDSLVRDQVIFERGIYISVCGDAESGAPDTSDIISHFKRHKVHFWAVFGEGMCISKDFINGLARPQALVGVAEKGHMKIKLIAEDTGGRTTVPPNATTIGRLGEVICRIEFHPQPLRKSVVLRDMLRCFAPYLSFKRRSLFSSLTLYDGVYMKKIATDSELYKLPRTTIASTTFDAGPNDNVLSRRAEAVIQIHLAHGDTTTDIERYLRALISGLGLEIAVLQSENPSQVSQYNREQYKKLRQSLEETFSEVVVAPALIAETTYANRFSDIADGVYRITPFIITEAEKSLVHGTNERIGVDSLERAVNFYKNLIKNISE